jgi:tRNA uridine 5-carboxymethylaminomethyl modification enzyme
VEGFRKAENRLLPPDTDYMQIEGLRIEARQKLCAIQPRSIGEASRISGVSPGDITVLLIWLTRWEARHNAALSAPDRR